MALRIPWDKQETAILIDAYLRVKNKEVSRQDAVKEVSDFLRRRAILSGIKIDEIFRNTNGISMQMKIISGLMGDHPSGLHSSTKMFTDMVTLYKNNPIAFNEILIQAREECTMQVNIQEKFINWLMTRVSPIQLSEYYIMYKDIESFAMGKRILTEPLFETMNIDVIQEVFNVIKSDRMFQLKNFHRLGKMCKAMEYYMKFLGEISLQQEKEVKIINNINSSADVAVWNFASENLDFSNKIPVAISYFGDEVKVQDWKDAFVKILSFLQEDYPAIIRGMAGYRFFNNEKVILTGIAGVGKTRKAVKVKNDLYLETDCDPEEIIVVVRIFMDKCNMDYDNLEISYEIFDNSEKNIDKNNSIREQSIKESTCINDSENVIASTIERRAAFENWLTTVAGLAVRSAQNYTSAINTAGQYSVSLGISEKELFYILDANRVYQISMELLANPEFAQINDRQHNRYHAALSKYWDYCKDISGGVTISVPLKSISEKEDATEKAVTISDISVASQVKEKYASILAENFEDGFRPTKAIDRNRFRMYYKDVFGEELSEDDEQLIRILNTVGTLRDERIFVKDETEQRDLIEEINETILETFKAGASCIYLECLFAKFQDQLANMLHVYNMDSFESVLFSSQKRKYFKRYNYLFGYDKEPVPAEDVVEYMKNAYVPVTYSEIEKSLWYIPLDKIKHIFVTTPSIVNVAPEAYLYAPNVPVSASEIRQITELISHALLQQSYVSDVELMQLIENHCPSVLMNTPNYPTWGLRNALAYILREEFSFRGAIISARNEEISMAEVFSDFCQRSEHITVDEIKQFASELNTVVYWDSVYSEMIRVNQKEFVRRDQIHFDIEQTDAVLDSLILKAYVPIKAINLFLHFPTIDVPWNNFVLESYVGHYSKKFRLLHAGYTAIDYCGAIVRQDSDITNYRTLIVDVLANNASWKNKKDALQLLVDLGYQRRRNYSDIENVMQEAMIRKQVTKK